MALKAINDDVHYHPKTKRVFNLERCEWCNGKVQSIKAFLADTPPEDCKIWGDDTLPPETSWSETRNLGICRHCEGEEFYVDQASSKEWVIGIRPKGVVHSIHHSKPKAYKICDKLNKKTPKDSPPKNPKPEAKTETKKLTNQSSCGTVASTVVIRLAGNLDGTFKRGDHFTMPAAELLTLITKLELQPMTTNTERKTAKNLIRDLIIKKKTDEQIIDTVQAAFPESNIDSKHCTKYRRELFVEGTIKADLAAVGSNDHQEWVKGSAANLTAAKKGPHKDYWVDWDKTQKAKVVAAKKAEKEKVAAAKAKAAAKKTGSKK